MPRGMRGLHKGMFPVMPTSAFSLKAVKAQWRKEDRTRDLRHKYRQRTAIAEIWERNGAWLIRYTGPLLDDMAAPYDCARTLSRAVDVAEKEASTVGYDRLQMIAEGTDGLTIHTLSGYVSDAYIADVIASEED